MGKLNTISLAALTALSVFSLGAVSTPAKADVTIENPKSYETSKGMYVGIGLFDLTNTGADTETLVDATTDICDHVELHEMKIDGDVMQMRKVDGGLDVNAGQTVKLGPMSYHLMLIGLKEPLVADTNFSLTLKFASGLTKTVTVPVMARVSATESDEPPLVLKPSKGVQEAKPMEHKH